MKHLLRGEVETAPTKQTKKQERGAAKRLQVSERRKWRETSPKTSEEGGDFDQASFTRKRVPSRGQVGKEIKEGVLGEVRDRGFSRKEERGGWQSKNTGGLGAGGIHERALRGPRLTGATRFMVDKFRSSIWQLEKFTNMEVDGPHKTCAETPIYMTLRSWCRHDRRKGTRK